MLLQKIYQDFGRDHIDTSHYIERYFPSKNIRYIAVNDNVDTFDIKNGNNDMTPFKAVVNDMYARDTSKKVKTALLTKAMNGESIKPFAPYGYLKDPKNKNKLIVDEAVSENVLKIFELYHSGMSKKHICDYLENEKIPTPLKYKEMTSNYKNPNFRTYTWCSTSINKILRDRIYVGDLVQSKNRKINYKITKTIKNHPSQYIIVPNNHEAIVTREIFDTVQSLLDKQTNEWTYISNPPHLLKGLAFCSCGARITYNKNHGKTMRCVCSSYKNKGAKFCTNVHLKETDLIEQVVNNLREQIQTVMRKIEFNYDNVGASIARPNNAKNINKKISDINNLLKSIYVDKVNNIISTDMFAMLSKDYENQKSKLMEQLQNDKNSKHEVKKEINKNDLEKVVKEILQLQNPYDIDRNLLNKLIKKITINDKEITAEYNFKALKQ